MKNINDTRLSPFLLDISFNKLLNFYEEQLNHKDETVVAKAKAILEAQKPYPILRDGISEIETLEHYRPQIDILLRDIFAAPLSENEIKMATLPFQNYLFYSTRRFRKILKNAGPDFKLQIDYLSNDEYYVSACTVILRVIYGFDVSYKRPYFYEIPDANGVVRHYKILYNADFIEILPTENAPVVTQEDFDELLDNFRDVELWKSKIPPQSYIFKGFILANMVDVTDDQSISNIKTTLISNGKRKKEEFMTSFKTVFKSLLGINDLDVGFLTYKEEDGTFERVFGKGISSFLINNEEDRTCDEVLCNNSFDILINKKEFYTISDVDKFYKLSKGKAPQYKTLRDQKIKSAILAPIANDREFLGVLELVSKTPKVLNSVNAARLVDVMPFIVSSVERSKREQENLIEAVIQQECTSIHSSVKWKFEKAALRFIQDTYINNGSAQFKEITIEDVYPLFGQVDIQGSSNARNHATQKDLSMQLNTISKIFDSIMSLEVLPFYENIQYQLNDFKEEVNHDFKVDSEQLIYNFVVNEVHPILNFQANKNTQLRDEIEDYFSKIDVNMNVIYYYRKNYDDTVALINKNMSTYLDAKQVEAQSYYPHYFERYKTDGVEHNMYIGEAITKNNDFNKVYLYNLRLWQLQVMCEMENEYYQNQNQYPISLDITSMILVFGSPLSIRFRMDEKRFDVDGTYNARYEVVKKRVDKANIKGTDERITQKGKLAIVYSRKEDEVEYLRYVKFLQFKKILDDEIEIVELEDLQGVTGLQAIRVSFLYHNPNEKEFYTYADLMKTI